MPYTDNQGSASPLTSFGRSIWNLRRENDIPTGPNEELNALELELESFQKQVAGRFNDLVDADELLSISWIQKLLDAFICCQEEFRVILLKNKAQVSKPPLDRLVAEYFERSVKGLDVCNAIRDGIEKIRLSEKQLEIVLCALESRQRALSEGQFLRARKALMELALTMLDEKESGSVGSGFAHRNRSFSRHIASREHHRSSSGHSRSLSWSVSRSWSAAKQLQATANSLVPPRANEIVATNGLTVPVFTMSFVLLFVLWVLVAAIPCQDRSLNTHFTIPRQFPWGGPLLLLHERIIEESKKRDHRSSNGLLRETCQVERSSRCMTDFIDSVQFPLTEDQKSKIQEEVQELGQAYEALKRGLDGLEGKVREMFRVIVNCRIEGLDFLGRANSLE